MLCLMSPESRVPADHPLRAVRKLADAALADLSGTFDAMYSESGRPSVPPERLLKSMLLMALYSVRSERLFCEQLDYNLLYRWFLGMDMTESSFDATTFSKNRERLLQHEVTKAFFERVVEQARAARLTSSEHFTVDGTLIDAWCSMKSFQSKLESDTRRKARNKRKAKRRKDCDGKGPGADSGGSNPTVDFHGEKRRNDTHASTTDPEARLYRKGVGKEARLCYSGHALMENRNGLLMDLRVAEASGLAERREALAMVDDTLPGEHRITVAADKGYNTSDFVRDCRARHVTPHVADKERASAIDGRTTTTPGYGISQRVRKRVEEIFGWMKTVGGLRRSRFRGQRRTQLAAYMVGAAYNLVRMTKLLPAPA